MFEGNPSISKGVIERTRNGDGRTEATKQIQYSIIRPIKTKSKRS